MEDGSWSLTTPIGQFDTNKIEAIQNLHWIAKDEPNHTLPLEIYMRDYYEPRLLSRLLKGEKLPSRPSLAELNRNQPKIEGIKVIPHADTADLVDVGVKVSSATGQCIKAMKKKPCESGVYDLRLYRDSQLVGQVPGLEVHLPGTVAGQARQEFIRQWRTQTVVKATNGQPVSVQTGSQEILFKNIRLPKGAAASQVEFTAYAFNEDRVKSTTSVPVAYKLPQPQTTIARRRAYVVTVGVNLTDASTWKLLFAPNGARDIDALLREQLKSKYEVVPVQLISDLGKSENKFLATKGNIQTVLDILAGKEVASAKRLQIPNQNKLETATPDDLVVIYIASHGYDDPKGMFYIVPSDIGPDAQYVDETLLNRCLSTSEQSSSCSIAQSFLQKSISSEELTNWLQTIDAGEMALILDSCHSAAVTGPNFKPGPMGDKGFGQLSYDKGMRVLVASQADGEAVGGLKLNDRSILTYALTRPEAISEPFDMHAWLGDAVDDVLSSKEKLFKYGLPQEPIYFDFTKNRALKDRKERNVVQ